MWPSMSNPSNGNQGLKGYNLILLDDDVNCHKVEDDDFMIFLHKFEFVDLSDLFSLASANANIEFPEFSTDVIGVLEDFEYISNIKTVYGEKKIVKFRLTDGKHSHKVTVWEALAATTDAAYRAIEEQSNTKEAIIVIISSTKIRTFRNSVQINTLPSSKIYLNLDNEVLAAMRQRLDEEGYVQPERTISPPTQTENVSAPVIETLTLKELSEKTSSDYLKDETEIAYPTVVKEISGKDITVQIELNDDNILLNSTVYHATDAYQYVLDTSSKSETTISGFGASAFGDVST
ncbi:hypothetical protein POM88_012376 [Heracleum sosnowskyi]|uniref:Uncharacterized protein n=1 Tax=Heracleum sosnowskyi TaxID=360622 RepID=A0AAD8IWP0_9APIA|nr:hypothetical protein POM88_012376 [Heracleum sosnowskyi]